MTDEKYISITHGSGKPKWEEIKEWAQELISMAEDYELPDGTARVPKGPYAGEIMTRADLDCEAEAYGNAIYEFTRVDYPLEGYPIKDGKRVRRT